MSKFDLVASNQNLVIDLCEDSKEAEQVRVWRRDHGFTTLMVLGGSVLDLIEVRRDAAHLLHPKRILHSVNDPWLVISVRGGSPPKLALAAN